MTQAARALGAALVLALVVRVRQRAGGRRSLHRRRLLQSSTPSPAEPRRGPTYVALGDSYTACGPIGTLQEHGFFCQRSSRNYP